MIKFSIGSLMRACVSGYSFFWLFLLLLNWDCALQRPAMKKAKKEGPQRRRKPPIKEEKKEEEEDCSGRSFTPAAAAALPTASRDSDVSPSGWSTDTAAPTPPPLSLFSASTAGAWSVATSPTHQLPIFTDRHGNNKSPCFFCG